MPLHIEWSAILLRLVLSAVASAAIGVNRGEQDRPAGLRTTMLVSLAATISMIQVNVLLPIAGKPTDSFVVMDLMRLPLGILSGIGFIGAGAILVQGVTTAATLWFATVMGLCFGGGQIALGVAALAVAILVLWPLKWVELWVGPPHRGFLTVSTDASLRPEQMVMPLLKAAGYRIGPCAISLGDQGRCTLCWDIGWHERRNSRSPVELAHELGRIPGIVTVEWRPLEHQ
jgi:putative Mg2+ transporter-C (MgtC) family protein